MFYLQCNKKLKLKIASSICYAIALLIAVVFFENRAGFLLEGKYSPLIAYTAVIIIAGLTGYRLSHWYLPLEEKKAYMEFLLVPVIVVFVAVFSAGLIFGLIDEALVNIQHYSLVDALSVAVYSGIIFVAATWHVLIMGVFSASFSIGIICRYE